MKKKEIGKKFKIIEKEEYPQGLIDSIKYCINKRYEDNKLEKTLNLLIKGYWINNKTKEQSKIQNRRNMKLFDEIHLLIQIQEETILFYFIYIFLFIHWKTFYFIFNLKQLKLKQRKTLTF